MTCANFQHGERGNREPNSLGQDGHLDDDGQPWRLDAWLLW